MHLFFFAFLILSPFYFTNWSFFICYDYQEILNFCEMFSTYSTYVSSVKTDNYTEVDAISVQCHLRENTFKKNYLVLSFRNPMGSWKNSKRQICLLFLTPTLSVWNIWQHKKRILENILDFHIRFVFACFYGQT